MSRVNAVMRMTPLSPGKLGAPDIASALAGPDTRRAYP
jgi:hypothetical protein